MPLAASRHGAVPVGIGFSVCVPLLLHLQSLTLHHRPLRRDAEGTRSLLEHLLGVSFFSHLVAGPITRVTEPRQAIRSRPDSQPRRWRRAPSFLIGLRPDEEGSEIADYLAANFVNRVFDTPNLYSGAEALIAVYALLAATVFRFLRLHPISPAASATSRHPSAHQFRGPAVPRSPI